MSGLPYHVQAPQDDPVALLDDLSDQPLLAGVLPGQDLDLQSTRGEGGRVTHGRPEVPSHCPCRRDGRQLTVSPWNTFQSSSLRGSTKIFFRRVPGGFLTLSATEPGRFMP